MSRKLREEPSLFPPISEADSVSPGDHNSRDISGIVVARALERPPTRYELTFRLVTLSRGLGEAWCSLDATFPCVSERGNSCTRNSSATDHPARARITRFGDSNCKRRKKDVPPCSAAV